MALSDLQAILAEAHYNMASMILNQTCDIYQAADRAGTAWATNVSCICREPNKAEMAYAVGYGISYSRMFEFALQDNLSAALMKEILPKVFIIKFGGADWEILSCNHDVLDSQSNGKSTPAVLVCGCSRVATGGVGEIVGA